MSSAGFVAALALRRFRSRGGSGLAALLGVAAAAAVLAAILVGATVARDRSVAQAIDRLPTSSQSVRAVWFGVPAGHEEEYGNLAASAAAALAAAPIPAPTPIVLVRESTVGGRFVGLAAVDGLAPHVRLQSGRLPRSCRPERCEVLRLRGLGRLPDVEGLRIVEVGRATLRSRMLFGDFLQPTDNALDDAALAPVLRGSGRYHSAPPGPLVVAEGVEGLVASPALARTYRSYAWVSPLGAGVPRAWEVGSTLAAVALSRSRLTSQSTAWSVIGPEQELRAADRSSTTASRRLLLVGGEGVALLVAFAILAAGALRADLERARRRLTWYGARGSQTLLLGGVESVLIGVTGTLAGWLVGCAVGAVGASLAGAPVAPVLRASILTPGGIMVAIVLAVVATAVIWGSASLPARRDRRLGGGELAAGVALLLSAVAVLGGAVDEERLSGGGGTAIVLLVLPGLVALIAAVAASRIAPLAARWLARPGRGITVRLAATPVARRVGTGGMAVAFLTLAVGLALFAGAYRATLSQGEHDQAAFEVPADLVVREDLGALVPVLAAAPFERFVELVRPGSAIPVARFSASAGRSDTVSGVTVIGLDSTAIAQLPLWRESWGVSRREFERIVGVGAGARLQGERITGDTLRIRLSSTLLDVRAVVRGPDGRVGTLTSVQGDPARSGVLTLPIAPELRGGTLVALDLIPPRILERGADAGVALRGSLVIRVEGVSLTEWVGTGGVTVGASRPGPGVKLAYTLTPQRRGRLRPVQPTDSAVPQVVVTEALASLAGGVGRTLPLRVNGELIAVEIAGIVSRFPSIRDEAVVGNLDALTTAVATEAPGSAGVDELWLDLGAGDEARVAAALGRRPFLALEVASRAAAEGDRRRDPLGNGTLIALAGASIVALLLAVVGLGLAVRADLRDERSELVDLEAQGASPALLRRVVRVRALFVLAAGLIGGGLAGVALALLVTRVIRVTARAGVAEPPLVATIDVSVAIASVVGLALVATVVVGVVTRSAFSDPRGPGRVGGGEGE